MPDLVQDLLGHIQGGSDEIYLGGFLDDPQAFHQTIRKDDPGTRPGTLQGFFHLLVLLVGQVMSFHPKHLDLEVGEDLGKKPGQSLSGRSMDQNRGPGSLPLLHSEDPSAATVYAKKSRGTRNFPSGAGLLPHTRSNRNGSRERPPGMHPFRVPSSTFETGQVELERGFRP